MNAQLVRVVAAKLGVATERVFGLSFEWAESRHSRKYILNQFKHWYFDGKIHPDVEDFILDVMSGRVLQKELPYDTSRQKQPANLPK